MKGLKLSIEEKMKKIIKYSLLAAILLPVVSHAATYEGLANDDAGFSINEFGPNKYQKVLGIIKNAEVAFKKGELQTSEKLLLQGLVIVKGDINAEVRLVSILGGVYAKQQQPEKLLSITQDIVQRYPEDNLALSALAGAQIANKQHSKAEAILQKIITQEPQDINHRLLLVNLLLKSTGREKDVENLLNEVLKIQANNPKALLIKTKLQIQQKQFKQAAETIKTIEGFYPKEVIGLRLKGDLILAQKKSAQALGFYQQAYKIEPNNELLFLMADLMKLQKEDSAALALLNDAVKKDNKNLAVHLKLGNIYQQLQEYQLAEKHFNAILEVQADNVIVLNNLAWNYLQQGRPEALKLAKRAYEISPKSGAIADTYGVILLKQGDKKEGLAILKLASEGAPKILGIQYHLAQAYSETGNQKQAIEILQKLEKHESYFPEKKEASELLKKLQAN